ncbi:hypothetical protein ACWDZW_41835, partial [Streptomyces coeruleorubidus]
MPGPVAEGTGRAEVGAADGARGSAVGPVASPGPSGRGRVVAGAGASDGEAGEGVGEGEAADGWGVGARVGGAVLAGGGAIGTVGERAGSGAVWRRGSAMRAAAAQHRPAPAAAR